MSILATEKINKTMAEGTIAETAELKYESDPYM